MSRIRYNYRRRHTTVGGGTAPGPGPGPTPSQRLRYRADIDMYEVTLPDVSETLLVPNVTRAGYPGGIPNVPGNIIITPSGNDTAAINAAVSQAVQSALANPGQYVVCYFDRPEYTYSGRIALTNVSNLIFRGRGKANTRITFSNGSGTPRAGHFDVRASLPGGVAITSVIRSETRGARTIRLANNSNILNGKFAAGKYVLFTQQYYPPQHDKLFSLWRPNDFATGNHFLKYLVKIVAVNASTSEVTLQYPLPYDIYSDRDAKIAERPNVIRNIGFEGMTLEFVNTTAHDGIYLEGVDGAWIKDVDFVRPYSFPFQMNESQHIEIDGVRASDAVNTGGNYNGYFGYVGVAHSLIRNSYVKNHRHMLFQGNALGCAIVDTECENMDVHYHAGASINCLMDRVILGKGSSGQNWHFDGPTNENSIHRPEGYNNVMWNFDAWNCGKWGRSWKLFFALENSLFAYGRIRWGGFNRKSNGQPADRIPGVTVFDGTGPVRFAHVNWGYDKAILLQHTMSDQTRAAYEANACFMDFLPGVHKEWNNNGTIEYGRQSGWGVYPSLTAEQVFIPYRPEVPNNADVRLFSCKVTGLPENRLFFGYEGKGPVKNEGFISSPIYDPNTLIPDRPEGLDSLFYAQKAHRAAHPEEYPT